MSIRFYQTPSGLRTLSNKQWGGRHGGPSFDRSVGGALTSIIGDTNFLAVRSINDANSGAIDSARNFLTGTQDISLYFFDATAFGLRGAPIVGASLPGFSFTNSRLGTVTPTYVSGANTTSLVVRVASACRSGDVLSMSYRAASAGSNPVKSSDGAPWPDFSAMPVPNGLTTRIRFTLYDKNNAPYASKSFFMSWTEGTPALQAMWRSDTISTDASGVIDAQYIPSGTRTDLGGVGTYVPGLPVYVRLTRATDSQEMAWTVTLS